MSNLINEQIPYIGEKTIMDLESIVPIIIEYGMNVLGALLILYIGFKAAKWGEKTTYKALSKMKNFDKTLGSFLSNLVSYAILAFTIMAVLSKFGVQTASLVAVLGAAGLAIGLALQGTLGHVASGVMLLIFRPFKIGDYVDVAGKSGTVQAVTLFTTELSTPDNIQIIMPNGQVWDQAIVNYSKNDTRRVDILLGIAYEDDIDVAQNAITALVTKDARVLKDPAPMNAVMNLGESSVDIVVRVWCKSSDYWSVKFDLTKALKQEMDKKGISIPYPQRTLHVVNTQAEAVAIEAKPASKKKTTKK